MEDLMTLKEYAEKHPNIGYYTLRKWALTGMKHVGRNPIRIKPEWVEEFVEEEAKRKQAEYLMNNRPRVDITGIKQPKKMTIDMKDL